MHRIALQIWKGKDKHRFLLSKVNVIFTIHIKISFLSGFLCGGRWWDWGLKYPSILSQPRKLFWIYLGRLVRFPGQVPVQKYPNVRTRTMNDRTCTLVPSSVSDPDPLNRDLDPVHFTVSG
jgi:hypothetical protein